MSQSEGVLKEWSEKVPGSRIVINGEDYPIEEVVTYRQGTEVWVNLVTHNKAGRELAVEFVKGEDKLTLWQRIPKIRGMEDPALPFTYKGEKYVLGEKGVPQATVKTREGTETAMVPYWVHLTESGRRVAVEIWDKRLCCYVAEETPPQVSF